MIPVELIHSISYKLLVSTVERETGPFKVSKHEQLHETLTEIFPPYIVFC